jgi:hypothetical protein
MQTHTFLYSVNEVTNEVMETASAPLCFQLSATTKFSTSFIPSPRRLRDPETCPISGARLGVILRRSIDRWLPSRGDVRFHNCKLQLVSPPVVGIEGFLEEEGLPQPFQQPLGILPGKYKKSLKCSTTWRLCFLQDAYPSGRIPRCIRIDSVAVLIFQQMDFYMVCIFSLTFRYCFTFLKLC